MLFDSEFAQEVNLTKTHLKPCTEGNPEEWDSNTCNLSGLFYGIHALNDSQKFVEKLQKIQNSNINEKCALPLTEDIKACFEW